MPFRTIIISSRCKLEYSLNFLVFKTPEETKRILLSEISTLIIETNQAVVTTTLLNELVKNKINVIICDEKRNPSLQLMPFYSAHNGLKKIEEQLLWNQDLKDKVWKEIIKGKIKNQALFLKRKGFNEEYELLMSFRNNTMDGDVTNREGHAAKVYFNKIYGNDFSRHSDHEYNIYLNYGYTIMLSLFNRVLTGSGYLTQIGIHHKGEFNPFNLSCDLIEPLRIMVELEIEKLSFNNYKEVLQELLSKSVKIAGKEQSLSNAVNIYCNSIFSLLNNGEGEIKFIEVYGL